MQNSKQWKIAAILNFLNKILGFYYGFNEFKILSVNKSI